MNVTFYGVRGSTPCPCPGNHRYGGNTSCVALESPGREPVVLDLGTGLRFWGETLPRDGSFRGHALVTHLHWDHVQGLPFFGPVLAPGARLDVYGPPQEDGTELRDAFDEFMRAPFFPVGMADLPGEFRFHTLEEGWHTVGDAKVRAALVPHVGPTLGFRVEMDDRSVVYLPDHQQPASGMAVDDHVLELCDGADLLVHDAQYTPEEFERKAHWGHCTVEYACHVAREAGVRRLVLFHHDPSHDDNTVDELLGVATAALRGSVVTEVLAAFEGLTVAFDDAGVSADTRPAAGAVAS